ncbi:MAG: Metalloprotease LoiP [Chlamydiae bacterium]|nr:Metalloprotease LoiP [Chlamydiota bacterium]
MKVLRAIFFLLLICGVVGVSLILIREKSQPPFSRSFAPLFQELGKPVKSFDRVISRMFPINDIDEKVLGDQIKLTFARLFEPNTSDETATVRYLNSLISSLTDESSKPFDYRVYLVNGSPNAFAYPGGIICVTKELINILESEAELVAVLSHEIGHIERGHLFDAARGEMLRRKIHEGTVITYADDVIHMIASLTFSKAQEDEADEYGFRMLLKKVYDPIAMSTSFEKLIQKPVSKQEPTNPFEDFFTTHPYTELRIEKFRSRANLWKENFPNENRYIGKKNLVNKQPKFEVTYPDEWDYS